MPRGRKMGDVENKIKFRFEMLVMLNRAIPGKGFYERRRPKISSMIKKSNFLFQ